MPIYIYSTRHPYIYKTTWATVLWWPWRDSQMRLGWNSCGIASTFIMNSARRTPTHLRHARRSLVCLTERGTWFYDSFSSHIRLRRNTRRVVDFLPYSSHVEDNTATKCANWWFRPAYGWDKVLLRQSKYVVDRCYRTSINNDPLIVQPMVKSEDFFLLRLMRIGEYFPIQRAPYYVNSFVSLKLIFSTRNMIQDCWRIYRTATLAPPLAPASPHEPLLQACQ